MVIYNSQVELETGEFDNQFAGVLVSAPYDHASYGKAVRLDFETPTLMGRSYGSYIPLDHIPGRIVECTETIIRDIDKIIAELTMQRKRLIKERDRMATEGTAVITAAIAKAEVRGV